MISYLQNLVTMKSNVIAILCISIFLNACSNAATSRKTPPCDKYAEHIASYSQVRSKRLHNNDIEGIWTSSSCETYHGPQFILREITLRPGALYSTWNATFHHFEDGWCTRPIFSILARGSYRIDQETTSKHGYRAEFAVDSLSLIRHSEVQFAHILRVAHGKCPGAGLPNITRDRAGRVFLPPGKKFKIGKEAYRTRACRTVLGLHFNSFKLVRMLSYYKESPHFDELYFGIVPTHKVKRSYVPETYQYLLKRSSSGCRICKAIMNTKGLSSPSISEAKNSRVTSITGKWVSHHCEAHKDTFVTRYLRFYAADAKGLREWELNYFYFGNEDCSSLSYVIKAFGNYSRPIPSKLVSGALNVTFNLQRLKITPMDDLIISVLKTASSGTCGESSKWDKGVEQDVTSTKGCSAIGLGVPSVEYDILKVNRRDDGGDDLYTGQRPTDNSVPSTPDKRPTSFQVPLHRCGDLTDGVSPLTTGIPTEIQKKTFPMLLPFTIPENLFRTKEPMTYNNNNINDPAQQTNYYINGRSSQRTCNWWLVLILVFWLSWNFL